MTRPALVGLDSSQIKCQVSWFHCLLCAAVDLYEVGYKLLPVACCGLYEVGYKLLCIIVQELCESRGGRPGLSVLTSLLVSVDVKLY